mmetsp:Transcript_30398/g.48570  ORF Transcript_30398/g.48570 Transcript_30398/m.48570 type:complete len:93 (+) Transcript_30398:2886-3164(+)
MEAWMRTHWRINNWFSINVWYPLNLRDVLLCASHQKSTCRRTLKKQPSRIHPTLRTGVDGVAQPEIGIQPKNRLNRSNSSLSNHHFAPQWCT